MPTPRTTTRRLTGLAALAAAGLALAAAPASADSIAYLKGGDVWLSTPDGARQYQVTFTGGYSTVSQSDFGKLVATKGDRLVTMTTDGTVLHDIRTPHSYTMPGTSFAGPFDATVSPDGMRIAYSWYYTQYGQNPSCNPSTGCHTVYGRQGTNYIAPAGDSPFDKPGWNEQTGWVGPSWDASSGGTIISDPIQVGNADAVVHTPGDAHNGIPGAVSPWFFDPSAPGGLKDGEMSRDEQKLAFVTGEANDRIYLYRGKGGYPNVPENCFKLDGHKGRIEQPSWAPDASRIAYSDDDGVYTIAMPDFSQDCGTPTETSATLLIPGGHYPDWGRSDVPPARPNPGPQPGGPGGPVGPQPGGPALDGKKDTAITPTGGTARLTVPGAKTLKLRTVLKSGLKVKVVGAKPGKLTLTAKAGKRKVASGTRTVGATGSATVKLTVSKAGRKALKGKGRVTLKIAGAGVSTAVTVKR